MQCAPHHPRQGAPQGHFLRGAVRREKWHMDVPFTDRRMEWHALFKDCNAALDDVGRTLWASQEAAICVVALP
ncbi:MAG: hypothetical protein KZQ95_00695 [Candidatus Thiodiazotropha sp. (ex Epidulcina cf. delphinae)]|nr:hypothetical protein [Candidatus Thiodiazotropha sp. (ex Epidulcina cf. delphinae)]